MGIADLEGTRIFQGLVGGVDVHKKVFVSGEVPDFVVAVLVNREDPHETVTGLELKDQKVPRLKIL